jgi:hypothetical protein
MSECPFYPQKADIVERDRHVRFVLAADGRQSLNVDLPNAPPKRRGSQRVSSILTPFGVALRSNLAVPASSNDHHPHPRFQPPQAPPQNGPEQL